MHCPHGNATEPIWRVLASSDGISSWTPLKPQHSKPNPNHLANQLWCIDFLTPATPLIIPRRLPAYFESLMPLKNWCWIHARFSKSNLKHSIHFCGSFSKFKTDFAYCSSKVSSRPDCFLKFTSYDNQVLVGCIPIDAVALHLNLITKISQSSHKMYSNNTVNFQESTTISNACTLKVWKLIECISYMYMDIRACISVHTHTHTHTHTHIYIYIYIYIYNGFMISILRYEIRPFTTETIIRWVYMTTSEVRNI